MSTELSFIEPDLSVVPTPSRIPSRFTPRKNETDAVREILNDDTYDEIGMAKAIVKSVAGQLFLRDAYVIASPGLPLAWGPYWSEAEVRKVWEKVSQGQRGYVLAVRPYLEPEEEVTACSCGHHKEQHVVSGSPSRRSKPKDCAICDCDNYKKRTS